MSDSLGFPHGKWGCTTYQQTSRSADTNIRRLALPADDLWDECGGNPRRGLSVGLETDCYDFGKRWRGYGTTNWAQKTLNC